MVAKQKALNIELPELAFSVTGSAIVTPKLIDDKKKYLNIKQVVVIFGMTETCAAGFQTQLNDDDDTVKDHVGLLENHLEAKVIDKDGKTVPFGQPGEMCLRGYCTMLKYWNDEEKTREVLSADKW